MASSGNVPREIYAFAILGIYIVFGFLYAGLGNLLYEIDTSNQNYLPNSYQGADTDNSSGFIDWATDKATDKSLDKSTKGLFKWIITGFDGMPEWLNIVFILLSALAIALFINALLHG